MNIIRLQGGDEEKLREIINIFPFKDKSSSGIEQFLENPLNYFLVAYQESNIIGYLLGYQLQKPETDKPKFMIYDIEVLESHRRQGVGKGLIEEFKGICKSKNGSAIFVPTNKSNLAAMKLYESTGGKQEVEDDVIFVYECE